MKFKYLTLTVLVLIFSMFVSSCSDADVASQNISRAAEQFEIYRRVVFLNGITNDYMLSIEGLCSIDNALTARSVAVTCKTGVGLYKKHLLGLSDNVTFFVEQTDALGVSAYYYRVTFKPQTIVADVRLSKQITVN